MMGLGVFHHHPFTGLPCDCGYGRPKFTRRTERTAGVNWNRALKNQVGGKKFQMIEDAPKFVAWMNELMQDDDDGWVDEIAPFLVKEFRSGNVTFNENRQAFFRIEGSERRLTDGIVSRWGRWAAARQHPTRRGVNVTGPDLTTMNIEWKVGPFMEDMRERERHEQRVADMMASEAPVVYEFNDGWTVRDLARAEYPGEEMELEGQVMDHCIGNHGTHPHNGYSYIDAVQGGDISHVYSVRDPDGLPHITMHLNGDGSLAEIHGFNDQESALRKYAPRAAHFLRDKHPGTLKHDADSYDAVDMHDGEYPWQAVGNRFENPYEEEGNWDDETGEPEEPEEEENPYLDEYEVSAPTSVSGVYDMHEAINSEGDEHDYIRDNVSPDYYTAHEEGHSPDLSFLGPQWGEVVHDMNTLFAVGDEERDAVREFIGWLGKNDRRWLERLRQAVASSGTDELQRELAHQDREAEIQQKINEMFPGAENPKRLFNTILEDDAGRSLGDPWDENQYMYPVTDQSLGHPDDQYLAPTDKRYFINRQREQRMKGMRDEGHSWEHIRDLFGAGGYADETNHAQQSLNALRQEEYQAMRMKRRDLRRFVQNREETDAPRDPRDPEGMFIPYTMDDVQNKARQLHWQEMVNSGLTPDTASQRILEYERRVRNNSEHCQVCGDFGGGHARDCPNRAENLQGRLGPPEPAGGGQTPPTVGEAVTISVGTPIPRTWTGTVSRVEGNILWLDTAEGPVTFSLGPHLQIRPAPGGGRVGSMDEFADGLDKIPGVRRTTPVPNHAIEHNVGDRVVSEYNSPLDPDPRVPAEFHGTNLNAGTVVAKHPPGTYHVYADDSDGGFEVTHNEPSYHVQWDLGADWDKPMPYFRPGRMGEHLPQSRLWPEGHEALGHGLTDPKDPKSLELMYPPTAWGDADPADAEPWS